MTRPLTPARDGRAHLAALAVGLLVAGGILVGFARRLYFYGDDWEFLLHRGTVAGADRGLLAPHNEHWSTVPVLVFRALFPVFGLDHYVPYALPVILAHLALCALAHLVLVRLGSAPGPALVAALTLAFFGGGAANTLWDFQVGFIAPLALAWSAVWAWSRWGPTPRGVAVAGVLLVLALMCSGVGISAVVLVACFALLTGGVRAAVAVAAGPTLVFLAWYATVGRTESSGPSSDRPLVLAIPHYVWTGLTAALERTTGVGGSGVVLLLVLVAAALLVRDVSPGVRALALAGIVTAFVQFLLQAWTRVGMGVEQATSARYAYLTVTLLLPAFALACGWLARLLPGPRWALVGLVTVVGLGYVAHGVQDQRAFVEVRQQVSPDLQRLLRGVQAVTAGGAPVLVEQPFPTYHPDITVPLLDSEEARAALSQAPVTQQTALDGLGLVQVGVGTESFGLPPATDVRPGPGSTAGAEADGCVELVGERRVDLELTSPPGGAEVRVVTGSRWVTTRLVVDGRRSLPNVRRIEPGTPVFVGVRVPGATLQVRLPGRGASTVCPAG